MAPFRHRLKGPQGEKPEMLPFGIESVEEGENLVLVAGATVQEDDRSPSGRPGGLPRGTLPVRDDRACQSAFETSSTAGCLRGQPKTLARGQST